MEQGGEPVRNIRGDLMLLKCFSRSMIPVIVGITALLLIGCSAISSERINQFKKDDWMNKLFVSDSLSGAASPDNNQRGLFPVDPLFSDFYSAKGGEKVLGPVISPLTVVDGQSRQFVETGLMVFDPRKPESQRFALAPLGVQFGVDDQGTTWSSGGEAREINGHLVVDEFLEYYEQLGGARFVGKPISDAQYDQSKGRLEQYFENLGFYKLDGESRIRLLPYGAFACNKDCRKNKPSNGIPALQPVLPEPFLNKTLELGLPFVGKPLTSLHLAPDGNEEVIFENVVLFAEFDNPNIVNLRPITTELQKNAQELAPPQNSELVIFVEIEHGLGHNVPVYFIEYLDRFGGLEVSGDPISEVFSPKAGVYWQCFSNLCLQFDLNADPEQRLRPVPLGDEYKTIHYDRVRDFSSNQTYQNIEIKSWEKEMFVSSRDYQELYVALYEDGKPLQNYEPVLIVTMPDGTQHKGFFQPSGEDGQTSLKLAPIDAPSGTLIAYRICLPGLIEESLCVGDNYLIWNYD